MIIVAFALVTVFLLQPETFSPLLLEWRAQHLRELTGDNRYQAEHETASSFGTRVLSNIYRPFSLAWSEPVIIIFSLYLVLLYFVLFTFLNGYTFTRTHNISNGLTFILWAAMLAGVFIAVAMIPWIYSLTLKAAGRAAGAGQQLQPEGDVNIWSPIMASFVFRYALVCIFTTSYMYIIFVYLQFAASALGFMTFARYIVSGALSPASVKMYEDIGPHWSLTISAIFASLMAPVPFLLSKCGRKVISMHLSSLLPAMLAISGMATASTIPSPFLESRQSSPAAGVVYSKCSKPGVFALAFDDGPGRYTEELIKTLNAAGAKATFFFTGTLYSCIYNRAAAVKAVYASGHQVASHTWTHPQTLDSMSVSQLTTEMQKLETALVNIIGVKPTYMRPPYLKTGGNVPTAMRNLGYKMITDSVDSQDWNGLSVLASEQKFRSAGPSTYDGKGHISLLHETYATTVRDLVPRLIKWAKENNLKMVTVAECLGDTNGAYAKGIGGGAQQC
ncbi:glycoside hydrolase/deacetylase, partial [Aureobasidium melanogenum]